MYRRWREMHHRETMRVVANHDRRPRLASAKSRFPPRAGHRFCRAPSPGLNAPPPPPLLPHSWPPSPRTLLALTEDEQRTLYDRVAFLDRCGRAMYERLPGTDLSMFDALAFLERAVELRATARRRETRE